MNTTMTLRIDQKTKTAAQKTFAKMGLDLSSAVKLFLKQSVAEQGLPFKPRTVNGHTEEYENSLLAGMKELDIAIKNGTAKTYRSAGELHAELLT
jgi:DNA-damage-inducible protein J